MIRRLMLVVAFVAGLAAGCSDVPSVSPTAPEYKQPKGPKQVGPKSQFE